VIRQPGTQAACGDQFEKIITYASKIGIDNVSIALCIVDSKIKARMNRKGLNPVEVPQEEIEGIRKIAENNGVVLRACVDARLTGFVRSSCIDKEKIRKILPKGVRSGGPNDGPRSFRCPTAKDTSQRKECNCVVSRDIGDYDLTCFNACIYCYANPIES
jgi:hypothetical protein